MLEQLIPLASGGLGGLIGGNILGKLAGGRAASAGSNSLVGIIGGTVVATFMPMDHMLAGEAMNHGLRIRLFGMLGTGAIGVFIYARIAGLSFRRVLDVFALPTLAGLAIHLAFPLAPPRMLSLDGFVDTARIFGPDPYALGIAKAANEFWRETLGPSAKTVMERDAAAMDAELLNASE